MRIPILFYHKIAQPSPKAKIRGLYVTPKSFYYQMRYLKWRGYTTVTLLDILQALNQEKVLPPRSIALTFDDGYENNYTYTFPILKKFSFTATIFIVTRDIGEFPDWPDSEERIKEPLLSWEQIKEMHDYGISIQSHTHTHASLTKLQNEAVREELLISKRIIEKELKTKVDFLCYPKGYFNSGVMAIAKETGYRGAVTTKRGVVKEGDNPYNLKRIGIKRKHTLLSFIRYIGYKYR